MCNFLLVDTSSFDWSIYLISGVVHPSAPPNPSTIPVNSLRIACPSSGVTNSYPPEFFSPHDIFSPFSPARPLWPLASKKGAFRRYCWGCVRRGLFAESGFRAQCIPTQTATSPDFWIPVQEKAVICGCFGVRACLRNRAPGEADKTINIFVIAIRA